MAHFFFRVTLKICFVFHESTRDPTAFFSLSCLISMPFRFCFSMAREHCTPLPPPLHTDLCIDRVLARIFYRSWLLRSRFFFFEKAQFVSTPSLFSRLYSKLFVCRTIHSFSTPSGGRIPASLFCAFFFFSLMSRSDIRFFLRSDLLLLLQTSFAFLPPQILFPRSRR